jgi:hypothetical protein
MRKFIAALFLTILGISGARAQNEPTVRIGLSQNAATVSLRAGSPSLFNKPETQTAKFTMVVALDPNAAGAVTKASLQYRTLVGARWRETDSAPKAERFESTRVARLLRFRESNVSRSDRGIWKLSKYIHGRQRASAGRVFTRCGSERVPDPTTFGEIEALKAQAVAAHLYRTQSWAVQERRL